MHQLLQSLTWSDWHSWDQLPYPHIPLAAGVYQVRAIEDTSGRLFYIGEGTKLQGRLRELINGHPTTHLNGYIMRQHIANDISHLAVRWAPTPRHQTVELLLLAEHYNTFDTFPQFNNPTHRE